MITAHEIPISDGPCKYGTQDLTKRFGTDIMVRRRHLWHEFKLVWQEEN